MIEAKDGLVVSEKEQALASIKKSEVFGETTGYMAYYFSLLKDQFATKISRKMNTEPQI